MMITVGAYALNSPIWFAVGLVVMIFIHEMGHVLAAKQKDCRYQHRYLFLL
ncbi:hypothetical protein P7H17_06465 [Paenibacillus larvae]|nr:hypothetical protein [Paenibacillus larvae]MDT2259836.1 hypothetical protein [Paenibacillus larvae]MDT2285813.1 hypothetical protein [Paenibacillus larvae]